YHDRHYDPVWALCQELDMPVVTHSGPADKDSYGDHLGIYVTEVVWWPARPLWFMLWSGVFERFPRLKFGVTEAGCWWAHRAFTHLLVAGVFERHPGLRLVLAEQGTAWIPDELLRLDYFFDRMRRATGSQEAAWGLPVVGRLSLKPSEYWARQCAVGASFIRPFEVGLRDRVGIDKIMWGSDYPHREGSHPYSREAVRASFAGVDAAEVALMLGGNAAAVYGFDLDALRPLADQVGPTVAEVAEPLSPASLPADAEKCPALVGFAAPQKENP
nr:amidohydrolase family protein [Micromonospora sp. DSM 115978]